MAKMAELREMDEDELTTRLIEAKQELFNLRFQHVTGQLDNYARLGQVRKEIARITTLLREREIEEAEAAVAAALARRQEEAEMRRARLQANRRGVIAGVGREAALWSDEEGGSDRG
jgi:large subunit ribosomal protein L29